MKVRTPESGVLRACLDLLAAERIWHRRWNSGAIRDSRGIPVRMGKKGDADILAVPRIPISQLVMSPGIDGWIRVPALLWIECKGGDGRQSEEQCNFEYTVKAAGHFYLIVRSSDDLLEWLHQFGAKKAD